ncbi:MAG: methyltransferase domain-containing protein [Pseudomonadota bacterium]
MRVLWRTPFLGRAIFDLWRLDARRKVDWFTPFVAPGDRLIEIGSGPGSVQSVLAERGLSAYPLDIADSSFDERFKPHLYDGKDMPFEDRDFDTALLLTILHHTPEPDAILREASRIARRLILVEDVFNGPIQRYLTYGADSVINLEFLGHPHTNRDDLGWRATFDKLGLNLVHADQKPFGLLFRQALYVVDCA